MTITQQGLENQGYLAMGEVIDTDGNIIQWGWNDSHVV